MTTDKEPQADISEMSFEAAMSELEGVVRTLETGETSLESSISVYERGVALKMHCETQLKNAKAKIDKITISADGEISTAPLDE